MKLFNGDAWQFDSIEPEEEHFRGHSQKIVQPLAPLSPSPHLLLGRVLGAELAHWFRLKESGTAELKS